MIAGSVGLLAARMPVFLSFAVPTALPVIVHLFAQGDWLPTIMGGMADSLPSPCSSRRGSFTASFSRHWTCALTMQTWWPH
jgi:hypothetical protein